LGSSKKNQRIQHFQLLMGIQTPMTKIPILGAQAVKKADRYRKKRAAQGATLCGKLIEFQIICWG
jgi:hypothetical protein